MRYRCGRRAGVTLIEWAVAAPVVLFFIFALVIGGAGVFRYQEVAHLAREAARYASTHGGMYEQENATAIGNNTFPYVDKAYLTGTIIKANAAAMDTSKLQIAVVINTPGGSFDWDSTGSTNNRWPETQTTSGGSTTTVTNTVSVTVTYPWVPELYVVGPINLTSTSTVPMCY